MKILVLLLATSLTTTLSAQQISKEIKTCKVDHVNRVPYDLISSGRGLSDPIETGLRIVVAPKFYNAKDMEELAHILRLQYCQENHLSVVIFDAAKPAKEARAVVDQLTGKRAVPELRGFYSLDRTTDIEKMSFSTKRGNPTDEVKIQFGK